MFRCAPTRRLRELPNPKRPPTSLVTLLPSLHPDLFGAAACGACYVSGVNNILLEGVYQSPINQRESIIIVFFKYQNQQKNVSHSSIRINRWVSITVLLRNSFMYPKWRSTRAKVTSSVRAIIVTKTDSPTSRTCSIGPGIS